MSGRSFPWDEWAVELGYKNEKDMLENYTNDPNKTFKELADILGIDRQILMYRRRKHGLKIKKSRGGANNKKATNRNWKKLVTEFNYKTEHEMWEDLRIKFNSYVEIGKYLFMLTTTVEDRMIKQGYGFKKKPSWKSSLGQIVKPGEQIQLEEIQKQLEEMGRENVYDPDTVKIIRVILSRMVKSGLIRKINSRLFEGV